jgi:hypothetical protein
MLITSALATVALAVPAVATAPTADAHSLSVWKRIAQCESGQRWHINTHNGYYGGLQISHSTWAGYGGRRYAYNANRTSRANQIRVAERIQRGQGWGAWPVCAAFMR